MTEWRSLSFLPDYEISEFGQLRRTVTVKSHLARRGQQTELSRRYGVSKHSVHLVIKGKIWREPEAMEASE